MLLEAFFFGVAIALAIGPIALLILHTGINHGLRAGLACGTGAACADFAHALVAFLAGAALLGLLDAARQALAAFAALLLCALGAWLCLDAWRRRDAVRIPAAVPRTGFLATFLLTLANPLTILFFAAWIGSRPRDHAPLESLALAVAVFAGSLLVQASLAGGGHALRAVLSRPRTRLVANFASGLGIAAFGIYRMARL